MNGFKALFFFLTERMIYRNVNNLNRELVSNLSSITVLVTHSLSYSCNTWYSINVLVIHYYLSVDDDISNKIIRITEKLIKI